MTTEFAAYIGLDWADQKHFYTLRTAEGKTQRAQLDNTPQAVEVWAVELAQRFGGQPVAIALEQSRGAVVAMLRKYAHLVVFAIHPNKLNDYRKAARPSGAKSDPVDADLALELLCEHRDWLQRLDLDTLDTRRLQFLTEQRRRLVNEHSSHKQELIGWLKHVFPQILQWFDDPASAMVGQVLLRWPTLEALQGAKPDALRKFFQKHNCRSQERIEERLAAIGPAVPATNDAALLETAQLVIEQLVAALGQLRDTIAEFDRRIAKVYAAHEDAAVVSSFPGLGPALAPRVAAALGTHRDRYASASSLACAVGIAPVTEASGNQLWIHWRFACPKFLRQTFHEWAGCSIRCCGWAREHYDRQRAKGKGHHAALRSLAFKWLRILFRCWRDRTPYSEQIYLSRRPPCPPNPGSPASAVQWKSCAGFSKISQPNA
jgi:transposase